MPCFTEIASGLQFPEGPIALPDGSVLLVEIRRGTLSRVLPDGGAPRHVPVPDAMTTNICFGGAGLRTAYITASMSGRLLVCEWETSGLALNFLPR